MARKHNAILERNLQSQPPMLHAPNRLAGYSYASQRYIKGRAKSKLPDDTIMIGLARQYRPKEIAVMYNCHPNSVRERLKKMREAGLL